MRVTMLQTRSGGALGPLLVGQTYDLTEALGSLLVGSNLAVSLEPPAPSNAPAFWETRNNVLGMQAPNGVRMVAPVPVVADSTTSAARNAQLIQYALDEVHSSGRVGRVVLAAQPGATVWIDRALEIGDNTHLEGACLLKQVTASSDNLLVTKSYKATPTNVTLTYTSGLTCSVAWTGHPFTVGDYCCIEGQTIMSGTPSEFLGCLQVRSITDANNFVISLMRNPKGVAPTGTFKARKATVNFHIEGLAFHYNYTAGAGSTASGTLRILMILLPYAAGWSVRNIQILDCVKHALLTWCGRDWHIDGVYGNTLSAGPCLFGPTFNGHIERVSGTYGDDPVNISSRDLTGNYIDISGGDVIGCTVENCTDVTTTNVVQVYSHAGVTMSGLTLRNINGNGPSAVKIFGDPTDGGSIESITLERIGGTGPIAFFIYGTPGVPRLAIGRVTIREQEHNPRTINDDPMLYVDQNVDIEQLVWDHPQTDISYATPNSGVYLNFVHALATIKSILVRNGRFVLGTSTRHMNLAQNMGLQLLAYDGCRFKNGGEVVRVQAAVTENPTITFRNCSSDGTDYMVAANANCRVSTTGGNYPASGGQAFLGVFNAAATSVKLHSGGGNEFGVPAWTATNGVTEFYGFDLRVDVGATGTTKTVSGQYCFNTGAARGTLTQNRLVTCNGSAFVQVDDTTKTF